jgi:hypothetical protein
MNCVCCFFYLRWYPRPGTCHASDLPLVFHNYANFTPDAAEIDLAQTVSSYYVRACAHACAAALLRFLWFCIYASTVVVVYARAFVRACAGVRPGAPMPPVV